MSGADVEHVVEQVRGRLDAYRRDGLPHVQGWFMPHSAEVMGDLLAHQVATGVSGNVAEIGVHHGKSFLLLANGTTVGERALALDLYKYPHKDVDPLGDRGRFEENLRLWAPESDPTILQQSSLDLPPDQATAVFGDVRMFSIDGGHSAEITRHDLTVAEACVTERGIVVLDDVLNAHWLGVMTAVADYLAAEHGLTPFAYSPNKLYLAGSAAAGADYAAHLREACADLLGKGDVEFFGVAIDIYGKGSARDQAARAESAEAARGRRQAARESAAASDRLAARLADHKQRARRRARRQARRLARAEARIADLEASASWRVTAPLRRLSGLARRVRRGPG